MPRSIYDYTINKPDDFIQFVSNDYFAKEGFRLVNYKGGEQVWKRGTGFLVAPSYIKLQYGNGVIHIEAWIKSLGEKALDDSFVAAIPKSQHKDRVNTLINLLNQPVAVPNQQPVMAGGAPAPYGAPANGEAAPGTAPQPAYAPPAAPIPVAVHNPTGKATLALIMGLVSFLGFFVPIVGVICGAVGVAAGRTGRTSTKKGMATAGLVLSIIGLVLSIIVWVLNFILSMAAVM